MTEKVRVRWPFLLLSAERRRKCDLIAIMVIL